VCACGERPRPPGGGAGGGGGGGGGVMCHVAGGVTFNLRLAHLYAGAPILARTWNPRVQRRSDRVRVNPSSSVGFTLNLSGLMNLSGLAQSQS